MIDIDKLQTIEPEEISSRIPKNCKNIIFWDTCGILDIINLVVNSTNDSFIRTLIKINEKIDNNEIVCFSSTIVITEINDNFHEPYGQADKLINDTLKSYNKIMGFMVSLGLSDSHTPVIKNSADFLPTLERMVQKLLNNILFINDDQYLKLARDRVVFKIPPAGMKSEFKDCIIWETCIDLAKRRVNNETVFFVSSNESDFGKNGSRMNRIIEDCDSYKIDFLHKIHELYAKI